MRRVNVRENWGRDVMVKPSGKSVDQAKKRLPITLVWVERTTDSTAAGAHLRGTIARLRDPRFRYRLFTDSGENVPWMPSIVRQALRIGRVIGGACSIRPRGVLLARWSPFISLVSRRWARRGLPTVLLVQGNLDDLYDSNPWTKRVPWITKLALESIRTAAHIVTPSEGLAAWVRTIRHESSDSITVIPNGVDVDMFARERDMLTTETAPHVLFFGNMAKWQGIDTVLEALQDPLWPADLGLHFIGDGEMTAAVRDCGDERVRYLGRLPKAEVARAAAKAELSLATRHADGASATGVSPFKILESAAAGTPCIVTRVPGQTELAADIGGAMLIAPGDPHALAEAVAALHEEPERRAALTRAGLEGIQRYDWATGAPALTAIVVNAAEKVSS